jgi:hypothetical protein
MKKKFLVLSVAAMFLLSIVGVALTDTKNTAKSSNALVPLLPASDIVITLDAQRLNNQALPQIFSANPAELEKINAKIDEVKAKTGLDFRQFQQVAVGISNKQISAKEVDFEPFILARGSFNTGALVAIVKLASDGKYREEKIGSRKVYIFTAKEIVEKNKPQQGNSMFGKLIDKAVKGLSGEIALTAYDANTLAIGTLPRVREAFEKKTRLGNDVLGLVNRNPNAMVTFGGKLPNGLADLINLGNDELGKTLNSIRQVSCSLDVAGGNAVLSIMAKTQQEAQAQTLHETLQGLQMVGKALLGGMKGEDKKVYAQMAERAEITRSGTEILLNLQVPQSEIDVLIGRK